jgi:hypothetical protein
LTGFRGHRVNSVAQDGIAVPVGRVLLAKRLPQILEDADNALSVRLRALLQQLLGRWSSLDPS